MCGRHQSECGSVKLRPGKVTKQLQTLRRRFHRTKARTVTGRLLASLRGAGGVAVTELRVVTGAFRSGSEILRDGAPEGQQGGEQATLCSSSG